tara:strand:+ start:150213 stop:150575 length:363 start_codon:yes stop_codon:yes gene_type:complete
MAYTTLMMQYPSFDEYKKAPIGLSLSSALLGPLVPLFRGHYSAALFWLLAFILTLGLSALLQMVVYNKQYLVFLLNNGYLVKDSPLPLDIVSQRLSIPLEAISENLDSSSSAYIAPISQD